jgi:hypothetical protein
MQGIAQSPAWNWIKYLQHPQYILKFWRNFAPIKIGIIPFA